MNPLARLWLASIRFGFRFRTVPRKVDEVFCFLRSRKNASAKNLFHFRARASKPKTKTYGSQSEATPNRQIGVFIIFHFSFFAKSPAANWARIGLERWGSKLRERQLPKFRGQFQKSRILYRTALTRFAHFKIGFEEFITKQTWLWSVWIGSFQHHRWLEHHKLDEW